MRKACLFLIVSLLVFEYSFAAEWYKGGTLHDATLREWCDASYRNRLATCADFIVVLTDKSKHGVLFRNNMTVLRNLSEAMKECITEGSKKDGELIFPSMKAAETGALCWQVLKRQIE